MSTDDGHDIAAFRLPGLGPMRQTRLEEAGITTLETLLSTDPDVLSALPGFPRPVVDRLMDAARAALDHAPPVVQIIELDPSQKNLAPVSVALRRGLDVARRVEDTRGCIRRTRALLKAQVKHGKHPAHASEARAAAKKLVKVLAKVQREAITHGLSEDAAHDLDAVLGEIERRLERFGDRRITAKRMRKLHGRIEKMRRALKARLT